MMMREREQESVLGTMERHRLMPVVVIDEAARGGELAAALAEAGLPVVEFTLRTAAALGAIRSAAAAGRVLVGAGTVVTVRQAEEAVEAGARFLVSPGVSDEVIRWAVAAGVPVFPGVATATEIMAAMRAGAEVVKFFPAEPLGGVAMLRALAAPFSGLRFVPTGGIGKDAALAYLREPRVLAVGGSWMVPGDALKAGDFDRITGLVREAVSGLAA